MDYCSVLVIAIHLKEEDDFYTLVPIKYQVRKQNTGGLDLETELAITDKSGAAMLRKPTLLQQSSRSISAARLQQRCKLRTNFRGLKIVSLDFPTRFGAVHEISSRGRGHACLKVSGREVREQMRVW